MEDVNQVQKRIKNRPSVFSLREFLIAALPDLQVRHGRIFFHDVLREIKIHKDQISELRGRKSLGMWTRRPMKWDDVVNLVWYYLIEWTKEGYLVEHNDEWGRWWELKKEIIENDPMSQFSRAFVVAVIKRKYPNFYNTVLELLGK